MKRYRGLTPAQQEAFEQIAIGNSSPPFVSPRTIKSLLDRGLIEVAGETILGRDRFGPIAVPAYQVPIAEHIAWCAWCERQPENRA